MMNIEKQKISFHQKCSLMQSTEVLSNIEANLQNINANKILSCDEQKNLLVQNFVEEIKGADQEKYLCNSIKCIVFDAKNIFESHSDDQVSLKQKNEKNKDIKGNHQKIITIHKNLENQKVVSRKRKKSPNKNSKIKIRILDENAKKSNDKKKNKQSNKLLVNKIFLENEECAILKEKKECIMKTQFSKKDEFLEFKKINSSLHKKQKFSIENASKEISLKSESQSSNSERAPFSGDTKKRNKNKKEKHVNKKKKEKSIKFSKKRTLSQIEEIKILYPTEAKSNRYQTKKSNVLEDDKEHLKIPFVKKQKNKIDCTDPIFHKPFKYGWKREVVFRACSKNAKADVYYYTPDGQKLRSKKAIQKNLFNEELTLANFTLYKGSVGVNDSLKEIIRHSMRVKKKNSDQSGDYKTMEQRIKKELFESCNQNKSFSCESNMSKEKSTHISNINNELNFNNNSFQNNIKNEFNNKSVKNIESLADNITLQQSSLICKNATTNKVEKSPAIIFQENNSILKDKNYCSKINISNATEENEKNAGIMKIENNFFKIDTKKHIEQDKTNQNLCHKKFLLNKSIEEKQPLFKEVSRSNSSFILKDISNLKKNHFNINLLKAKNECRLNFILCDTLRKENNASSSISLESIIKFETNSESIEIKDESLDIYNKSRFQNNEKNLISEDIDINLEFEGKLSEPSVRITSKTKIKIPTNRNDLNSSISKKISRTSNFFVRNKGENFSPIKADKCTMGKININKIDLFKHDNVKNNVFTLKQSVEKGDIILSETDTFSSEDELNSTQETLDDTFLLNSFDEDILNATESQCSTLNTNNQRFYLKSDYFDQYTKYADKSMQKSQIFSGNYANYSNQNNVSNKSLETFDSLSNSLLYFAKSSSDTFETESTQQIRRTHNFSLKRNSTPCSCKSIIPIVSQDNCHLIKLQQERYQNHFNKNANDVQNYVRPDLLSYTNLTNDSSKNSLLGETIDQENIKQKNLNYDDCIMMNKDIATAVPGTFLENESSFKCFTAFELQQMNILNLNIENDLSEESNLKNLFISNLVQPNMFDSYNQVKTDNTPISENLRNILKTYETSKLLTSSSSIYNSTERSLPLTSYPHSMESFCSAYKALKLIFEYFNLEDLLAAQKVCKVWKDLASQPIYWKKIQIKNSQLNHIIATKLQKHKTENLIVIEDDKNWNDFINAIPKIKTLNVIKLCSCPANVFEEIVKCCPQLQIVNAVSIESENIHLECAKELRNLRELYVKTINNSLLIGDLAFLTRFTNLTHLSLRSIKCLGKKNIYVIKYLHYLETLELGECSDFDNAFGSTVLINLKNLKHLRLENIQGSCCCIDILTSISKLEKLTKLELVNINIKNGFDKCLSKCQNITKLLVIPIYDQRLAWLSNIIIKSTTNLLSNLKLFVWCITEEVLQSFKELFKNSMDDYIPILKSVPNSNLLESLSDSEIEKNYNFQASSHILTLNTLKKFYAVCLPETQVHVLKIPFSATWNLTI